MTKTKTSLTLSILLLLFTAVGCNHKTAHLLPNELVGFWTADEPRYQGRFLELYRAYVIIGTGEQIPKVQAVDSVETLPHGDHIIYRISSTDLAGVQYKMALRYSPAHGGEIRFPHMEDVVWQRLPENNQ